MKVATRKNRSTLACAVNAACRHAIEVLGAPEDVVVGAAKATMRSLVASERPVTQSRAQAYLLACVRRRLLKEREHSLAVSRLVVASVVEDLKESGRSPQDVFCMLERGWGDSVPAEVLEEQRRALCA